jgi:hypothetical protein
METEMIRLTRKAMSVAVLALMPAASVAGAADLRGSPASMVRQHSVAKKAELPFLKTPAQVQARVAEGGLVNVPGDENYSVIASQPYALPEVRLLIERLSQQYRAATGEKLVVTSLTRPASRQPSNAHKLSVHPAGMAIDLRVPANASARQWLESALLSLEGKGVLDATRERTPPHYHVAVFPAAYAAYVEKLEANRPVEDVGPPPSLEADQPGEAGVEVASEPIATAAVMTTVGPGRDGSRWLVVVLATLAFAGAARGAKMAGARSRRRGD